MIADAIARAAQVNPDAEAVACGDRVLTYGQLHEQGIGRARGLERFAGQRVAVVLSGFIEQLLALLALDRAGATAILYLASGPAVAEQASGSDLEPAAVLSDIEGWDTLWNTLPECGGAVPVAAEKSEVILFTSGTSGTPKPVVHTWASLAAAVRPDGHFQGRRWLLSYNQAGFAALQVMVQCLFTGGRLTVPVSREPAFAGRALVEDRVEFATGTPTFWRMLIHGSEAGVLDSAALRQITLGGEVVTQSVLDLLRATFPAARLTHIYASTEMGACFAVTDGKEGFPASYLEDPSLPCQLKIGDGGELLIRSRRAMVRALRQQWTPETWFATGDLVELRGDRCLFTGRKSDCIHVGGAKVYPLEVETVIRAVPGVREVLVKGRKNAITGELVTAIIVLEEGVDPAAARREITTECQRQLARYKAPAIIEFRQRIELTDSHKLSRAVE